MVPAKARMMNRPIDKRGNHVFNIISSKGRTDGSICHLGHKVGLCDYYAAASGVAAPLREVKLIKTGWAAAGEYGGGNGRVTLQIDIFDTNILNVAKSNVRKV
jgi:hypothetical protein